MSNNLLTAVSGDDRRVDPGHPVAIVDMNDRGGSVRAVAGAVMSKRLLAEVLADNPMGQREQATPMAIVRRLPP